MGKDRMMEEKLVHPEEEELDTFDDLPVDADEETLKPNYEAEEVEEGDAS